MKGSGARPSAGGTDAARVKRYLLGELSQDERARLDAQFQRDAEARALVEQVEEALIADYLSDRLDATSRGRFERDYLANVRNREKVEIARRLGVGAGGSAPVRRRRRQAFRVGGWLALVTAVLLNAWLFNYAKQRGQQAPAPGSSSFPASAGPASTASTFSSAAASAAPASSSGPSFSTSSSRAVSSSGSSGVRTSAAAPRIVAWSLAPIEIRAVTPPAPLVLPAEAEILALSLEEDAGSAPTPLGAPQVRVETANGTELWRGDALRARDVRDRVLARVEIPTARLGADGDLTVILFETSGGREQGHRRYLLRLAR